MKPEVPEAPLLKTENPSPFQERTRNKKMFMLFVKKYFSAAKAFTLIELLVSTLYLFKKNNQKNAL